MPRRRAWADLNSDSSDEDFGTGSGVFVPAASLPSAGSSGSSRSSRSASPAAAGGDPEERHLAAEMLAMAARLKELSAQIAWPGRRSISTITSGRYDASTLAGLAAVEQHLRAAQAQAAWHDVKVACLEEAALETERRSAAAGELAASVEPSTEMAAGEAALEAAEAKLEATKAAMSATQNMRSCEARRSVEALRAQLAAELEAASAAEREVEEAKSARDAARSLPELRKRRRHAEERSGLAETSCEELRASLAQLRLEVGDAAEAATRTKPLEQRVLQLERECQELQGLACSTLFNEQKKGRPVDAPAADSEELQAALAENKKLISEAREARQERDRAASAVLSLEEESSSGVLQQAATRAAQESAELFAEALSLRAREAEARAEVVKLRRIILEAEEQVRIAEDSACRSRERKSQVENEKRRLQLAKRKAEEAATLLEWRMQQAVNAKLQSKDRLGMPLQLSSLVSSRSGQLGTGHQNVKNAVRTRLPIQNISSDDIDSTTAASESLADCL